MDKIINNEVMIIPKLPIRIINLIWKRRDNRKRNLRTIIQRVKI